MIPIEWLPRAEPLAPTAAVAEGAAARRLCDRLLALSDRELSPLSGVAVDQAICVIGEELSLPWVDGIEYLGADPSAAELLVPTALEPSCHVALVARALARTAGGAPPPWAVLRQRRCLLSIAAARPIARAALEAWSVAA